MAAIVVAVMVLVLVVVVKATHAQSVGLNAGGGALIGYRGGAESCHECLQVLICAAGACAFLGKCFYALLVLAPSLSPCKCFYAPLRPAPFSSAGSAGISVEIVHSFLHILPTVVSGFMV
eukprot:355357-Chlamydomonas_euryale.AAC.2